MDELIHQFLLQSGYPRACIVTDALPILGSLNGTQPSFIIVDMETADPLGVIFVVDAVDTDSLQEYATLAGTAALQLGGRTVQGFVIRVDADGSSETEQVQFFKAWPNARLQQLSARTFPDVESLRVSRKIELQALDHDVYAGQAETSKGPAMGKGAYLPGVLLAVVAVADCGLSFILGHCMIDTAHSLLLVGAAALLSIPAMLRFQRH